MIEVAPAIVGLRKKSRYNDISDAEAIWMAAYACRGIKVPMPVIQGGKILGTVMGDPDNYRTIYTSNAYPDYDTAVFALSTGQKRCLFHWQNEFNTVVVDSWYDMWPLGGKPGIGAFGGTARTANQFTSTTPGACYAGGTQSPSVKYLSRFSATTSAGAPKAWILYDRVLTYETCSMTTGNQSMTNTLAAQRYISAGQPGLQICITADTVQSSTASNLTVLHYTNNGGSTGVAIPTTPTVTRIVSAAAPTAVIAARVIVPGIGTTTATPFISLAAGDTGVRLIANYTWSAAPTGTFCAALMYPLAVIPDAGSVGLSADAEYMSGLQAATQLTTIDDNACLNFLQVTRIAGAHVSHGCIEVVWT